MANTVSDQERETLWGERPARHADERTHTNTDDDTSQSVVTTQVVVRRFVCRWEELH